MSIDLDNGSKHKKYQTQIKMNLEIDYYNKNPEFRALRQRILNYIVTNGNLPEGIFDIVVSKNKYGIFNIADAKWTEESPSPNIETTENHIIDDFVSLQYNTANSTHRSTIFKNFIVDRDADPEKLCPGNHNLDFLKSAFKLCGNTYKYQNFSDFFWSMIEANYPKFFPNGTEKSSLIHNTLDLAIFLLDQYLENKSLYSVSDEDLVVHFGNDCEPKDLENIRYLLQRRRELISLKNIEHQEYPILEEAKDKAKSSFINLLAKIRNFNDDLTTDVIQKVVSLSDLFNDLPDTANQFQMVELALGQLKIYNELLINRRKLKSQEMSEILPKLNQLSVTRAILETTSEVVDMIFRYAKRVKQSNDNKFITSQCTEFQIEIYNCYLNKLNNNLHNRVPPPISTGEITDIFGFRNIDRG